MTDAPSTAPPRYTVLRERHAALGASFTDFGGWMMPVRYSSDLAEHRAVREAAGLFDVSHMAEFVIEGSHAAAFLDFALAGRISTMPLGKAKYSLLLADDGGIVDDLIVYRLGDDHFLIIANAGNYAEVAGALAAALDVFPSPAPAVTADGAFGFVTGTHVRIEDASEASALLALQGPRAAAILADVAGLDFVAPARRQGDEPQAWHLDELGYYAVRAAAFEGQPVLVARTGYTGEDGFELLVPTDAAPALWDALLAAGAAQGLVPAGLAARDTLRLEAGMPLYGHELTRDIAPAQAGLARVISSGDEDFIGRAGLAARADAASAVLVGIVSAGKRAGRAGYAVVDAAGAHLGEITSGALSPTLGHPIAMAYVTPDASAPGTELFIDVRGTAIPATVTALPFYRRKK
ncbi:glycine cleavage system aminomethyltransferase GcvT [Microbacterium sp. cx-55]|uniref:glycine cleavage system aminomethyltransferase GcvT n=1 Tax=Microbacterium sp. cx-55 TaxID=2875948 RepID=UPI001CC1AFAD|nr:glycine cleavage system aminomethyltransferase GcvT [Microbacterium sp. cx-55]MBZ4485878.1 glycine cleavage system aminomethyltransferase GcvT [Microbacterium sp. cx-55]UGB34245.1 glycine cleavage system aminomethyltransferase GcvT [Microbacterium sp. cx-55]